MKRLGHRQLGIAAVEMAVLLLPMLILCFGITEIGRALYLYNGLVKATRGAVRHASQPLAGKTPQMLRDEAIFLALCGKTACSDSDQRLIPGLTVAHIAVCDAGICVDHDNVPLPNQAGRTADLVSVTIGLPVPNGAYTQGGATPTAYAFSSVVPWVIPDISFGAVAATMAEQTP